MELIRSAKTIRLKSHHDKYLLADEDEERVLQDRRGTLPNARWTVELPETSDSVFRLKSVYGRYLTASNEPFLLGMTGRKVLQTHPPRLDSSVEWEPIRDGFQVKLKTRYGQFLRGNGGLKPWKNSVTHDIPRRTSTQDWVLWDVEIVEVRVQNNGNGAMKEVGIDYPSPSSSSSSPSSVSAGGSSFESVTGSRMVASMLSNSRNEILRNESSSSFCSSPQKSEGRSIYYVVAEDDGSTYSSHEQRLIFWGTSVAELAEKLEEATEITEGIIVCRKNPVNQALYPLSLRLPLPPNSTTVVVVRSSSKVAESLMQNGDDSTIRRKHSGHYGQFLS